jgi:hypothetical protein
MSDPTAPPSESGERLPDPALAAVVRRVLWEASQMQELQQRAEEITARISKLTPPPMEPDNAPNDPAPRHSDVTHPAK